MTLRALYAVMGVLTLVSAVGFLTLLTPPNKDARERMVKRGPGVQWVGRALFIWGIANAGNGFRLMWINVRSLDTPLIFAGWIEMVLATVTIAFSALASCFLFGVYLTYRRWEEPPHA